MRNRKALQSLALACSLFALPVLAEPVAWEIDMAHTRVGFSVAHLVVSEVEGNFKTFSGSALLEEKDLTKSVLELSIDAASLDTGSADRDKHLKSADFFDVQNHPKITFKSTKITKAGKGYKIKGDITIRGVTKPVTLDATLSEPITNPWGKQVRGGKISGKVKRGDFGLAWNKTLDKGGVLVGEDVTIAIKFELNK
jgi:polyisoprenoid-binding protein YceI